MGKKITITLAILFMSVACAYSEIPRMLNFQGRLLKDGAPINETKQLTFTFWDAASGGSRVTDFSEVQTLPIINGIFNTLIGKETTGGIPFAVFDANNVWLQIELDGLPFPRERIVSVGYSFRAEKADVCYGVIGATITSANIVDGTITNADISPSAAITGTKIEPNFGSQDITTTGSITVGGGVHNIIGGTTYYMIPRGVIVMWSGSIANIPNGWALCDGTQGTPNLRDRFIVGAGNIYPVNNTGGLDSVTLTLAQMPSHQHSGTTNLGGEHRHSADIKSVNRFAGGEGTKGSGDTWYTNYAGNHTHSFTTGYTGGGQPHENRPPYFALAFIMKL